jgi:hypothetical protein
MTRKHLHREGSRGRRWRRREVSKKILVPKGTVEPIQPIGPTHTHADSASIENAHAVTAAIVARDEKEAHLAHEQLGNAEADQAASEDEFHALQNDQAEAQEHRREYTDKVRSVGLGHMLVHRPSVTVAIMIAMIAAIGFEAISMSSPMALVSAIDFGGSARTEERIGAVLALLLALGYATVLAILSKRAGGELKTRHYRHVLEAEDAGDDAAEDRPPTKHALFADRMVWLAVGAGLAALFGASLVREAAVAILASASTNAAPISWWVFAALTMGIFVGLFALGYWAANPIAKAYAEMNHGIERRTKEIDAKRRECYRAAGRVETCEKQLQMIDARSRHDQLSQIHLAAEEIAWRSGGNPHIYGVTADPQPIQDVVRNPGKHVRNLTLPSAQRKLSSRIEGVRDRTTRSRLDESSKGGALPVVPATEPFSLDLAGVSTNGDHSPA